MKKFILLMGLAISVNCFSQDSIKEKNSKNINQFLEVVGHKESTGRYGIVSKNGYLGKYQFHPNTLKTIGVNVSRSTFLKSKEIQDDAMIRLMNHNKKNLRCEIDKYVGKVVNGILITESGILAAAHLGGSEMVKRFFRVGKDFSDGNGTKISSYMKKFGGYILDLK